MENFKLNIAYLAIFAMIFTSCSKEETGIQNDPENATLSFGALLNDLTLNRAANKGHLGFLEGVPECSEGAADYVVIGLSLDGEDIEWANGEERLRVDLVDGQMFTQEDVELELAPDEYVLEYFAVFNESGTMIWLAPRGGDDDDLSGFVENALPLEIDLRAGVKKYVEVDVLCYDDRFVNEYGYLFFEINENEAITFCIFGNYCDEDGRHYPASYSVSIWSGNSTSGPVLYTDVANVTGTYENGDAYAEPVCFALPDTDGGDEYYFEITLLNSDAYGDVTEEIIRAGVITDAEVRALNVDDEDDNTTEYYHFREGNCSMSDTPDLLGDDPDNTTDTDGDGVPDSIDECDDVDGPASNNGCPVVDPDTDGDGVPDSIDECDDVDGPASNNGCPVVDPDTDGDGVPDSIDECDDVDGPASNNGCPVVDPDTDGDGVPDSIDECDDVDGPASNNGCPVVDPDTDGDGVPDSIDECDDVDGPASNNGCPVVDPDTDGDGVPDSIDECDDVDGPASNNGCPVATTCVIEAADAGCSVAYIEGETGFYQIATPGETPTLYNLLDSNGTSIGQITVISFEGDLAILINAAADVDLDDYLVEVSQNANGSNSICFSENNFTDENADLDIFVDIPDALTYPFYIRVKVNFCT